MGQTDSIPERTEALQDVPRPVVAFATEYAADKIIPAHHHRRAQLIYAATGVLTVRSGDSVWIVPPSRALWMPPMIEHALRASGAVSMRTLYIEPDSHPGLPRESVVVEMSALLRELILRAMELPRLYDINGSDGRLMEVVLDEISAQRLLPLHLPIPRDPRLVRIYEQILENPADNRTMVDWATFAGASLRTLARLFSRETGLSFGRWRQQLRLHAALARLAQGVPVAVVAYDVGYDSPSAFSQMFQRALGRSPKSFLAD